MLLKNAKNIKDHYFIIYHFNGKKKKKGGGEKINDILRNRLKLWWLKITPISEKWPITSHLKILNIKRNITFTDGTCKQMKELMISQHQHPRLSKKLDCNGNIDIIKQ